MRQPESSSAIASTWVKRFIETRMKQRHKLKWKAESEHNQTYPVVDENKKKRGNRRRRHKRKIHD